MGKCNDCNQSHEDPVCPNCEPMRTNSPSFLGPSAPGCSTCGQNQCGCDGEVSRPIMPPEVNYLGETHVRYCPEEDLKTKSFGQVPFGDTRILRVRDASCYRVGACVRLIDDRGNQNVLKITQVDHRNCEIHVTAYRNDFSSEDVSLSGCISIAYLPLCPLEIEEETLDDCIHLTVKTSESFIMPAAPGDPADPGQPVKVCFEECFHICPGTTMYIPDAGFMDVACDPSDSSFTSPANCYWFTNSGNPNNRDKGLTVPSGKCAYPSVSQPTEITTGAGLVTEDDGTISLDFSSAVCVAGDGGIIKDDDGCLALDPYYCPPKKVLEDVPVDSWVQPSADGNPVGGNLTFCATDDAASVGGTITIEVADDASGTNSVEHVSPNEALCFTVNVPCGSYVKVSLFSLEAPITVTG